MSKVVILSFFMATMLCLAVSACSAGTKTNKMDEPGNAGEFSDPARPITVNPGEEWSITVSSNATTGYSWRLAAPLDEKVVKLVGSRYVAPRTDLLGAPGREVWTFIATASGKTTVSLKYIRPWEKDGIPAGTTTFTVIVK